MSSRASFMNSGFAQIDAMYQQDKARAVIRELWENSTMSTFSGVEAREIFTTMKLGFDFKIVEAFGTAALVMAQGELGEIQYSENGGIDFANETAGVYIGTAVVGGGGELSGIPKHDAVIYGLFGTGVWANTVKAGFDAARSIQPTVSTWVKGARIFGRGTNILSGVSIGYDFATGTANSSTAADGLVMAGGSAVIFFGGLALAPWVAGAGVVYGVISVAGGKEWLNRNLDISGYINFVQPTKP